MAKPRHGAGAKASSMRARPALRLTLNDPTSPRNAKASPTSKRRSAECSGAAALGLLPSHDPDGRASLSPASRVGRVPGTSSGSPGRTRPTGFMGREHGDRTKEAFDEPLPISTGDAQIRKASHPQRSKGLCSQASTRFRDCQTPYPITVRCRNGQPFSHPVIAPVLCMEFAFSFPAT
ncbi:MAG: hypothetical protein FJ398_12150 [Verrucomicrobia bacterium]|nr:hypothetical protein [Verrucomicrobiota bacterium]